VTPFERKLRVHKSEPDSKYKCYFYQNSPVFATQPNSLPEAVVDPSPAPVTPPVTVISPPKAPQSAQREVAPATPTRQPQVFRVGDRTHYSGAKGAMAVTCRGKELEVLNTRVNDQGEQECEIKASSWCASYWVLSRCLKKVR
jgi:hypothetical protein